MKIRKFREEDAKEASELICKTVTEVNIKDSPKFAVEELCSEYTPDELIKLSKKEIFM